MSTRYLYDRNYQPPALITDVQIIHPRNMNRMGAKGKIDTGACISIIPTLVASQLALRPMGEISARDYKRDREYSHKTYLTHVIVSNLQFERVKVIAVDRDDALIGRDILNRLKMYCDGKNQVFTLEDS